MLTNFTFQQIEAFLTTARCQSISKACDILFMSQPALSKLLKRFEENFGTPLFQRTNQGVTLTPAGEQLYTRLTPLYKNLDMVFQSRQDLTSPKDQFLQIAMPSMYDFCEDFAPVREAIARFHEAYPQIRVIETILDPNKLQNALEVHYVDLAIAPDYALIPSNNLSSKPICNIQQYITMSASHPLAQHDILDYEQFQNTIFLAIPYQEGPYSKNLMSMLCRQNGITPKYIQCAPNYSTVMHSARNGDTVTIAPKHKQIADRPLKYYPLEHISSPLQAVVAWQESRLSRAARLLLAML